jgi:NDP-sugar pyrophosphorylase family protein
LLALVLGAIAWVTYSMYPSTTLTVGVQHSNVDAEGKLTGRYKEIQAHLEKYGVELRYRVQADKFSEKPKNNDTLINGGFFVLKKDIFKYLKDDSTIWEKEPLEHLAKDRQLA